VQSTQQLKALKGQRKIEPAVHLSPLSQGTTLGCGC